MTSSLQWDDGEMRLQNHRIPVIGLKLKLLPSWLGMEHLMNQFQQVLENCFPWSTYIIDLREPQ